MCIASVIIYLNVIQIVMTASNYCAINFESVHCENKTMGEFQAMVFSYRSEITDLTLKLSDIKVVDESTFEGYEKLKYLNLDSNNIKNITGEAFSNSSDLLALSVKNNSLSILHSEMFNGLNKLESLYLDNNGILIVSSRCFNKLNAITKLTLSHNRIRRINSYTFSGGNLTVLDLSYNLINSIMPYAFSYKENYIEVLDLSHNKLTTIRQKSFRNLQNLQSLNMSYNSLTGMEFVETFVNLRLLDLSENQIPIISNAVTKLDSIEFLDLSNNLIKTIDLNMFDVSVNLTRLIMHHNYILCRWYEENYNRIPDNVILQSYYLSRIPYEESQNSIVYECYSDNAFPRMVSLENEHGLDESFSDNMRETCDDVNKFGFFEIYFWLSLGVVLVYAATTLCANCFRRSEEDQKLRAKSTSERSTGKPIVCSSSVTRNGTLRSHHRTKSLCNGSNSINSRGYNYTAIKCDNKV